jgi:hypothetical protein
MFAHDDGKIAVEEHFCLPTFEAYEHPPRRSLTKQALTTIVQATE